MGSVVVVNRFVVGVEFVSLGRGRLSPRRFQIRTPRAL